MGCGEQLLEYDRTAERNYQRGYRAGWECANPNESGKWLRATKEKAEVDCTLTRAQLAAIVAWMEDEE